MNRGTTQAVGFPPVSAPDARVLILGSMPGLASLRAGQYYAHPQNRFWPFMGALIGALPALDYPLRLQRLVAARIALWDVLACCEREGSLDSAIRDDSAQANDFTGFFAAHPQLGGVLFNGAKAESCFRRQVLPNLVQSGLMRSDVILHRLPSTSPANASQATAAKLAAWRGGLQETGAILIAAP